MAVPYRIDPHVHCRDGPQSYKSTIARTFFLANEAGVKRIIDMPNTEPPIYDMGGVKKRLATVPKVRREDYFLNVALSAKSVSLALKAYDSFPEVAAFKFYGGHSTGLLGVISEGDQQRIWDELADAGYNGTVVVHCEKDSLLQPKEWDPNKPVTHAVARPQNAETESIEDMLRMASKSEFKGTVYIAHVSTPESVDIIDRARKEMKIVCEVTPHHAMWTIEKLERPDGNTFKMNPPLRHYHTVKELQKRIVAGKVDTIGSDHAPHAIDEKMSDDPPSGFHSLTIYKECVEEFLPGIGVSQEIIDNMTYHNVGRVFPRVVA